MAAKRRRRTPGRPEGGSEEIVRTILENTLEQLEERGYLELSVDEIARAAGVNKTSVYRRWPSKAELVLAAVRAASTQELPFVESGDLRRDLVRLLELKAAALATPRGRKIAQALMAFDGSEREPSARPLREDRYRGPRALIQGAIERGALPADTDAAFLSELLVAPLLHRVLMLNEPIAAGYVARIVDQTLAGAFGVAASRASSAGPARASPKRRSPKKQP